MDSHAPSMLKPTLIGGALFGFLGGLPVVGALNCACCSLILAGGFLAAYLYSKQCRLSGVEFGPRGGALVGLIAGLFYSIASTVISALARLGFPTSPEDVEDTIEKLEEFGLPSESLEIAEQILESSASAGGIVVGFFVTLLVAAVFSTIGGLIGGSVFKNAAPPVAPQAPSAPPAP